MILRIVFLHGLVPKNFPRTNLMIVADHKWSADRSLRKTYLGNAQNFTLKIITDNFLSLNDCTHTTRYSDCKLLARGSCVRFLGPAAPPSCNGRCPSGGAYQNVHNRSFLGSEI